MNNSNPVEVPARNGSPTAVVAIATKGETIESTPVEGTEIFISV